MQTRSTPARAGAIVLGCLAAAWTACVVFSDVTSVSDLTLDHGSTAVVLILTLAAGHMVGQQARQWRILSTIGLALLFTAGTAYLVHTSAKRNAASTAGHLAIVQSANGSRAALEQDLIDAKARLQAKKDARDQVCRDARNKSLCKGSNANVLSAQADVDAATAKLDAGPIAVVENAGEKHAALVYSIIFGGNPEAIEHAIDLVFPFVKAVFYELGTLIFFGIGFAHKAKPAPVPPAYDRVPFLARAYCWLAGVKASVPSPVSTPERSETETEFASADEVLAWCRKFRRETGRNPTIPELQAEFHIPKTTAWRRIKEAFQADRAA